MDAQPGISSVDDATLAAWADAGVIPTSAYVEERTRRSVGCIPERLQNLDWDANGSGFFYIIDASGRKVGTVWGTEAEKIALARMWSASPTLLDACERAEWWLSTVPNSEKIVEVIREAITAAKDGRP